jgi:hypothetical protein
VEPFTQNNHDILFVCISTVPESLLLVFRKNRQLFLELLASIGINDIVVRKKTGNGGGERDLEMVVKEEMVVVAKGKLLKSRLQIAKEKREAQGARCQERRNAAPPSARKESPTFSNP